MGSSRTQCGLSAAAKRPDLSVLCCRYIIGEELPWVVADILGIVHEGGYLVIRCILPSIPGSMLKA